MPSRNVSITSAIGDAEKILEKAKEQRSDLLFIREREKFPKRIKDNAWGAKNGSTFPVELAFES